MEKNDFLELTLDWKVPVSVTAAYIMYTLRQNKKFANVTPTIRSTMSFLTFLMVFHNLVMCVFSFIVFRNLCMIFNDHVREFGLVEFLSNSRQLLQDKIFVWAWTFYVSKYVEIMDTLIVHLNKRNTSFLQMYHHAGAIIVCWLQVISKSHLAWIFVYFNSFVHTLMYLHYAFTSVKIKTPFKKAITYIQIGQFVIGSSLFVLIGLFYDIYSKDKNLRRVQIIASFSNLAYVAGLFVMFRAFAKKAYSTKGEKED